MLDGCGMLGPRKNQVAHGLWGVAQYRNPEGESQRGAAGATVDLVRRCVTEWEHLITDAIRMMDADGVQAASVVDR